MESTRRARTGVLAALLSFALVTSGAVLASPAVADEPEAPIVEVVETAPPADDTEGAAEDAPADELAAEETPAEDAPVEEDLTPSGVESAPLQTDETTPEADSFSAMAVAATITPTPSSVTADGVTVRVVGAGFDGIAGAYAALIETGTEASLGMGGGYVSFGYWMPPAVQFVDGAFDRELPLAAADALDRTKTYEVIVWQGHSAPDASTIYARAALTLTPEQWDVIDPPPVPATPTVSVSQATDLDRDGQIITVTGTGFVPSPPATTGTRPPLAGSFGGAYVVFAKFGENWKPSVTGSSRPRDNIMETKWGVAGASVGLPGLTTADGAFAIAADGTFSIELTVSTDEARDALAGNFGVYTYSGSGAKHAPFETFTPLTFEAPAPATPTVSVSATTDLDRDGQIITVTGTGFVPSPPATTGTRPPLAGSFGGAYVVFAKFPDVWKPSEGVTSRPSAFVTKWGVAQAQFGGAVNAGNGGFVIAEDGSFSIDIEVSTDEARDLIAGNFGIYTYSGSGAKHAPFETFTPLTFQAPAPATPQVTVSQATDLDRDGQTITVTGTGFVPSAPGTTATRPPLMGDFGGAYVVFAKFPDAWKPTEGVTSRPSAYVTKWGVAQAQFGGAVNADNGGFVIAEDGSFSIDIEVSTDEARDLAAGNFGVYTYSGGGAKHAPFETFTPLTFEAPAQSGPVVTAAVGGVSATEAAISVDASGLAGPVYAAIIERGTEAQLTGSGGFAAMAFIPTLVDGGFERIIAVPAQNLDATKLYEVLVWTAHTMPSSTTIQGRADIAFLPGHWAVLKPSTGNPGTGNPGTGNPGTGNPGTGNPGTQPGASVSLSVAPSALNPAVANTVTVSGSGYTGAGAANGVYVNIGSSSVWQPGQVPAQSGWIVSAWVTPGQLSGGRFSVELTIPAGAMTAGGSYGAATFAAHGLSITDRSLDAWSIITIDTTQAAAVGAAGTTRTPAATPPAATGLTLDRAEYTTGSRVSATASGFQPNETGIMVVLYSDPVVLSSSATADANGVVTWSGVLPAGVTGDHTLTFQGSVSVGTPIRILAADAASTDDQCTVSDATLTWGFKETFRSYVSGSIANGEWVVADGAAYETPSFSWEGSGTLDADAERGTLAFVGSVRFTGHGGVLDTTIANPRIELTGDGGAILLLDITGTTQSGDPVSEIGVEFAELDLGAVTPVADGEALTFSEIPATLTAAGSAAFGTYEAGSALDPITLAVVLDEGCGTTAVDTVSGDVTAPVAPGPDLAWVWWVIGALVLVVSIVAIVLVVRSRAAKQG